MDFLVGTFNTSKLYTLQFEPPSATHAASLRVIHSSVGAGKHSWLSKSKDGRFIYSTVWKDPNSIGAYKVLPDHTVQLINTRPVRALSGYVTCSATHIFSAGGPTGEVFTIREDGGIGDIVQELDFEEQQFDADTLAKQADVPHGRYGGLRFGAHSADLSPDGRSLYIADIGRNCIWTYTVEDVGAKSNTPPLKLESKHISVRSDDGPRHTWPHPNGKVLYSLQEHTSMVDVFCIAEDGVTLKHVHGVKIIPSDKDPKRYWADEVRLSTVPPAEKPKYLFASTRGLHAETMGYVAAFKLTKDGMIDGDAVDIMETATCGGIANAIEPAPYRDHFDATDYLALTDSQEGWVFMLSFDERRAREVARIKLTADEADTVQAATALWL